MVQSQHGGGGVPVEVCIIRKPKALSAGLENEAITAATTNDASGIDQDATRLAISDLPYLRSVATNFRRTPSKHGATSVDGDDFIENQNLLRLM